jgi:microcystin-dependent protein
MSDPYLGEIRMFGGDYAPRGWSLCDGSQLSIAENEALYTLLGTTYGGDGVNTFGLPDLRGRLPIGTGTGPGLSTRPLGQQAGVENVTLTTAQTPAHTHAFAAGGASSSASPQGLVPSAATGFSFYAAAPSDATWLNPGTVQTVGGGQPHDNVMPSLAVGFIIALEGIFPSQG